MNQLCEVMRAARQREYEPKRQLLEYTLNVLQKLRQSGKKISHEDKDALMEIILEEIQAMLQAIPQATTYREKDKIFQCQDLLLGLVMQLHSSPGEIQPETLAQIQLLIEVVNRERFLEFTLEGLFHQPQITGEEMQHLLSLAQNTEDEYQKGRLYAGMEHYKRDMSKLLPEAKTLMGAHLEAEFRRYLTMHPLDEDGLDNLELMADVSKFFPSDNLVPILLDVLGLRRSNINFYGVETLLTLGAQVPAETITALAQDLGYADLTYAMLKKLGKSALFPKEYATVEYLAKSDMVHWLMYPTELGKAPDEIEYLGEITYLFKKEVYHVFKYRSDSQNLTPDLQGQWLIGWSSEDGGTFSNFDRYDLYAGATVSATLKNIKKKLIG